MPSERNRVYIGDKSEAPDNAIVRQGERGRLFYRPGERGRNQSVGGDKENDLLHEGLERSANMDESNRIFVASEEEAPDGAEVKQDDEGNQFYNQTWDHAAATYPEDVEDEDGAHSTDAEDAGDGVESEESWDDVRQDLADRIHDVGAD